MKCDWMWLNVRDCDQLEFWKYFLLLRKKQKEKGTWDNWRSDLKLENKKLVVEIRKQITTDGVITSTTKNKGRHPKKNRFFLGKSPKLWVGGGQES